MDITINKSEFYFSFAPSQIFLPDVLGVSVGDGECGGVSGHASTVDEARTKVIAGEGEVKPWSHSMADDLDLVRWAICNL